jgi:hypothetical protein
MHTSLLLLFYKVEWAMPTCTLTTISPFEMMSLGKHHQPIGSEIEIFVFRCYLFNYFFWFLRQDGFLMFITTLSFLEPKLFKNEYFFIYGLLNNSYPIFNQHFICNWNIFKCLKAIMIVKIIRIQACSSMSLKTDFGSPYRVLPTSFCLGKK